MTILSSPPLALALLTLFAVLFPLFPSIQALGSASTLAVSYGSRTVCGIVAEQPTQRILCFRDGQTIFIEPGISFSAVSGGRNTFCGIRSGGYTILCWNFNLTTAAFTRRRLYYNPNVLLENLAVGDDQICATVVGAGNVTCWRDGNKVIGGFSSLLYDSISSGYGFSCGILKGNQSIRCWGRNSSIATEIENGFRNISMLSIVAGGFHVCGLNISGGLVCKGNNDFGQLDFPSNYSVEFSELALGERHSCGILVSNRSVICWGGLGFSVDLIRETSFELISSGSDFVCGLTTSNFSVLCWGPGWSNNSLSPSSLSLPKILPGPCVLQSSCSCGVYPLSQTLCSNSGNVCNRCFFTVPTPSSPQPLPSSPPRAYKANYFEERRSNAEKDKYSQNYFESMFHPLYYKMFRCKRALCNECKFCPFYHNEQEKKAWDRTFGDFMKKDRITYVKDKQRYYESTGNNNTEHQEVKSNGSSSPKETNRKPKKQQKSPTLGNFHSGVFRKESGEFHLGNVPSAVFGNNRGMIAHRAS